MILDRISWRIAHLGIALSCAALLGYALWVQHTDYLEPCNLCIIQRLAFMWLGAFALLAAIHNPAALGKKIYFALVFLGAAFGTAIAGWHVRMQGLPPDQVPECGPGLNYMLDNFPLMETLRSVFFASGDCADIQWQFLGLSMPTWVLIWFIGLGAITIYFTFRKTTHE